MKKLVNFERKRIFLPLLRQHHSSLASHPLKCIAAMVVTVQEGITQRGASCSCCLTTRGRPSSSGSVSAKPVNKLANIVGAPLGIDPVVAPDRVVEVADGTVVDGRLASIERNLNDFEKIL